MTPGSDAVVAERGSWQALTSRIREALGAYHKANPLRAGMPREELKSRLKLESRIFTAVADAAVRDGNLRDLGPRMALPEHQPHPTAEQSARVESLMADYRASPAAPPSVKESVEAIGQELWDYLVEKGDLVTVSPDVAFEARRYDALVEEIRGRLAGGATITVAEVRDLLGTSRKYALALMEHLDQIGVTVREGDARRLAHRPG
jgi:selenocysteine-specific elongation factor